MTRVHIVGPVYPYRAGIAYCTTRLAEELAKQFDVHVVSFSRQYPKRFYPGGSDVDETLRDRVPKNAEFALDITSPASWLKTAWRLRRSKPDAVVFVWWIWVWALPYRLMIALLPRRTNVILQCHNVGDKEPARWKSWLTNQVLRRGDVLVVHAHGELLEAVRRSRGRRVVSAQLPVHELGGAMPSRQEAKRSLGLDGRDVALFFGHVRPFKGLDIALRAWREIESDAVLLVAGEAWWESEAEYRRLAEGLANVRLEFRFIPDAEIATYFAAADVVLAPYRTEAQSGVVLTAFHFGRPVIAAAVGGIPQIVADGANGCLVRPEDPKALALAVDRFFGEADRGKLEEGAARSASMHSWEDYGTLVARLVRQP
ncbi:MAG TPA: glycosyltransferase [Thermoanaerobaculia bacterium]|nr:glycosyltransferase [Thermoanaerobaculia bacterium]